MGRRHGRVVRGEGEGRVGSVLGWWHEGGAEEGGEPGKDKGWVVREGGMGGMSEGKGRALEEG